MKNLWLIFLVLLISPSILIAQVTDRNTNTIDVLGSSRILVTPDYYKVQILIQEEEQKAGYQTIGKLPLDSIKINMYKNLQKYNINKSGLTLVAVSSQPLSQYPGMLINNAYEVNINSKEQSQKLVNELRFAGLKGVVITGQYTVANQKIQDLLYSQALEDARHTADILAKKTNKIVGAVLSIRLENRLLPADYENNSFSIYSLNRFEMNYKEQRATCSLRVIYELK